MFIFSPSEAEKQPREPKIVFLIGKLTNEWSTLLFLILPHIRLIWEVCRRRGVPGVPGVQGVPGVPGVSVVFWMFLSSFYDFLQLIWEVVGAGGARGARGAGGLLYVLKYFL